MWSKQESNYFEELEFGKTTVYKRKNPTYYDIESNEVTESEFESLDEKRVTYDEKQLTYSQYYMELENDNKDLEYENSELIFKSAMANMKVEDLEDEVSDLILKVAMLEMGGNANV